MAPIHLLAQRPDLYPPRSNAFTNAVETWVIPLAAVPIGIFGAGASLGMGVAAGAGASVSVASAVAAVASEEEAFVVRAVAQMAAEASLDIVSAFDEPITNLNGSSPPKEKMNYEKHLGQFEGIQALSEEHVEHGGHSAPVVWLNPFAFWVRFGGPGSPNQQVWVYLASKKDYVQLTLPRNCHANDEQDIFDTIAAAGLQDIPSESAKEANPFVYYQEAGAGQCWILIERYGKYLSFEDHQTSRIGAGHIG